MSSTINGSGPAFDVSPVTSGTWDCYSQPHESIPGRRLRISLRLPAFLRHFNSPHFPGTIYTAGDATSGRDVEKDTNGMRDRRQPTGGLAGHPDGQRLDHQSDTGDVALRGPSREDCTSDLGCTVEANDRGNDDDYDDDCSECTSIDSTAWSLLFQEVSSMVGMSDADHSTFCDSSQTGDPVIRGDSVCRDECYSPKSSETWESVRIPGLPKRR
ncbi:hypothetical protein EDD15DRAFT_1423746 [Pisolithus albus]|nr:hypothetical protein EDD15DRAFT_1423746 [Pisolithus albus]